jgi:hypothetical protein
MTICRLTVNHHTQQLRTLYCSGFAATIMMSGAAPTLSSACCSTRVHEPTSLQQQQQHAVKVGGPGPCSLLLHASRDQSDLPLWRCICFSSFLQRCASNHVRLHRRQPCTRDRAIAAALTATTAQSATWLLEKAGRTTVET